MLDGLLCFEYDNLEESVKNLMKACKRLERDVLGVETQIMIAVTKCDLLPERTMLCFGNVLEQFGIDYIFTSAKSWDMKGSGEEETNKKKNKTGIVNPNVIMKIMGRKMLEYHLNFCPNS